MKNITRYRLLAALFLATLPTLPSCVATGSGNKPSPPSTPSCPHPAQVKTELYFGCSLPDGSEVSELQWRAFMAKEVTPRFRDGLTVIEAYGQWLNHEGKLVREKTKLVIIIHAVTPSNEKSLETIRSIYKKRFRQESVLKVTTPVDASF